MSLDRVRRRIRHLSYPYVEGLFRRMERAEASRGKVLESIPRFQDRLGGLGTTTYGEWCYTVGLFHSLIHRQIPHHRPFRMLDIGCGTGRLFLATEPHMGTDDSYTGLDIDPAFIAICQKQYADPRANFIHYDTLNAYYSAHAAGARAPWPFAAESFELLTALSVWTHLNEEDWRYYLSEVSRVLIPGGRALISFFVLDAIYDQIAPKKTSRQSDYYPQPENKWVFDKPAYGSTEWFCPSWVAMPEVAIGVKQTAFDDALRDVGLELIAFHSGSWKDQPALFFQDIAELRRTD